MLKQSIRTLLAEIVDYAGLFPPAALEMKQVVANYAQYREDPNAWMLARLIVPVVRLAEFEAAEPVLPREAAAPWRISALAGGIPTKGGADLAADLAAIEAFNARHSAATLHIDTIELKAGSLAEIRAAQRMLPNWLIAYVELPISDDPRPFVAELAELGLRGKVRTGGVLPQLFPAAADLVRFMAACAAVGLPFKATAGLHHPIRAAYRLTYAPNSAQGMMYGYLNVFLTAAFLQAGLALDEALDMLQERDPAAFQFEDRGVAWRGRRLTNTQLAQARQRAIAFGSCSFREPVDELVALGLL
jgi:hypothetical protein